MILLDTMFVVDDPMLALIARFVVDFDRLGVTNEQFLKQQVESIKDYVSKYPDEERADKALEWIEVYAKQYRTDWEQSVITERITKKRCPDCPLVHSSNSHCEIHDRWVDLLMDYMGKKINSHKYVEESMELLTQHKDNLKVSSISGAGSRRVPPPDLPHSSPR